MPHKTDEKIIEGPPVKTSSGPYDSALRRLSLIPEVSSLRITIGAVTDATGKLNIAQGGSGSFMTQGAHDMFCSSFALAGVQLVELSPDYRGTIDWMSGKNMKGSIRVPQFIIMGSITALDFLPGQVAELTISGIGPKVKTHRALGRMDIRMVTIPSDQMVGGVVVASSSVDKQYVAVENEFGISSFLGTEGYSATHFSLRIGEGKREPLQITTGFMVYYSTAELLCQLLEKLIKEGSIPDRSADIGEVRSLLSR